MTTKHFKQLGYKFQEKNIWSKNENSAKQFFLPYDTPLAIVDLQQLKRWFCNFFLQALLSIQAFLRPFWLFKSFLRMKVCPSQVTKFELQWESTKGYVTNFKIQVNNFRKVSFGYHLIKECEQKFYNIRQCD